MKRNLLLALLTIAFCFLCTATLASCFGHKHKYDSITVVAPTCTEEGYTIKTCECGAIIQSNFLSALGHTEVIDNNAVAPTCTKTGLTEDKHCSVCNEVLSVQTVLPALGHNMSKATCTLPATCLRGCGETSGKPLGHDMAEATCTLPATCLRGCGLTEGTPLGHTEVIDKAVAPDCVNTGLTEGKHCSVCSEVLVEQEVVDALGHTEVIDSAVAPSCTETGLTEGMYCSVCNEVLVVQEEVDALGHLYEESNQCSRCKYVLIEYLTFTLLSNDSYSVKAKDVNNIPAKVIIPSFYNGKAVTLIEDKAFYWCRNLTSIEIPNSITSIGLYAFDSCRSLTEVNYLGTIDKWAEIEFASSSSNPVFYARQLKINGEAVTKIVLTTATKVSSYAFYNCISLTSAIIGDSVTLIDELAFIGCTSLTSVVIGDSITSIGRDAFFNCGSLQYNVDCGLNYLGNENNPYLYLIKANTDTTTADINVNCKLIAVIAFYKCTSLTSIEIPDSVNYICHSAFYGCSSLAEITLPFVGETKNGTINTHFGYIFGARSYSDNNRAVPHSLKKVTITGGSFIANFAFYGCYNLTSIELPDSVTAIDEYAFHVCSSLTSIKIPDSVTSFGKGAFVGCSDLQYNIEGELNYLGNENNPYLYLVKAANQSIETANINVNCKFIGPRALYGCSNLTSVVIHNSITLIDEYAFAGCSSLICIEVSEDNANYKDIDGNLYSKDGTVFIQYAVGKTDASFTIPDSVITICGYTFEGCSSLDSVVIGDSVTAIGERAFEDCSSLTSVVIGDSVTAIGEMAFEHCSSLTSVVIGDGVTSIGDEAFYHCDSLTSVVIPDSVTSIGDAAFYFCDRLIDVNYLGTIDKWAEIEFGRADANPLYYAKQLKINGEVLTEVVLTTATKISSYAFYNCIKLTSVVIGDSITSIGDDAFYSCSSLTSIEIPDSVTYIGNSAFGRCTRLTSIKVSENNANYKNIDGNLYTKDGTVFIQYAIGKTNSSFTIPDSVTSIGDDAFYYCTRLTSVAIPNSVTAIGERAFYYCDGLTSIEIPDSVTSIGDSAFYGCSSLTSVVIPDSVTSIANYAFTDCKRLTSIKYRGTQSQWNAISKGNSWDDYTGDYTITYNYTGE